MGDESMNQWMDGLFHVIILQFVRLRSGSAYGGQVDNNDENLYGAIMRPQHYEGASQTVSKRYKSYAEKQTDAGDQDK